MRLRSDLPEGIAIRAAHEALRRAGWSLEDFGDDGSWFAATRGELTVTLTVLTVTDSVDPAFAVGQTQLAVRVVEPPAPGAQAAGAEQAPWPRRRPSQIRRRHGSVKGCTDP